MIVLSLGAGVQSSTLLLMADSGEFDTKPDVAIFADTGWEPKAVYENLDYLRETSSIPIEVVSAGNVREAALASKDSERFHSLPVFGERGPMKRMCTGDFKVKPVRRKVKSILGIEGRSNLPPGSVTMWIGISWDEIRRVKDSDVKWIRNRWPLVERKMTRDHCLNWCESNGFKIPPRSSCIGCPYHRDVRWANMKRNHPEDFADAVDFDRKIRSVGAMGTTAYLHRSRKPLDQVDFKSESQDQMIFEECEGFCHV